MHLDFRHIGVRSARVIVGGNDALTAETDNALHAVRPLAAVWGTLPAARSSRRWWT